MYCPGKKSGKKHQGNYYKCTKCGATGCKDSDCTKHNFDGTRCTSCGSGVPPKIQ